jgi:hypothetical protein
MNFIKTFFLSAALAFFAFIIIGAIINFFYSPFGWGIIILGAFGCACGTGLGIAIFPR